LVSINWQGYYLDGKTATKRDAEIQLLDEGLKIRTSDGLTLMWPYTEIRQTQGFYENEPVSLERGEKITEMLVIRDQAFLNSLHRFMPKKAKRFHNPALRGLRLRLTVCAAAVLVVMGALIYLWGIPLAAKVVTPRIPVQWEKGMGESLLGILAPEENRCLDPELQKALDEMKSRLNPSGPYEFRIYITTSPVVNAVALPGGNIVVFRGLLEKTKSPEELAGVLAHEMQHIQKRHVTKRIIENSSTGLIVSAISGDVTGAMVYGVKAAHNLAMLSYSRQDEEEADAEGMKMFLKAGFDPESMISFFRILKEEKTMPQIPQYLSTHPDTDQRIRRLQDIADRSRNDHPAYRNLSFTDQWEILKKRCVMPGQQASANRK